MTGSPGSVSRAGAGWRAWLGLPCAALVTVAVFRSDVAAPFAWAGLALTALSLYHAFLASSRFPRLILINLGLLALIASGLEFAYASRARAVEQEDLGADAQEGFRPHPYLGYAPRSAARRRTTVYEDGELLYDVELTFGSDGLRVTRIPECRGAGPGIVFMGGSFTMGEGVEDSETLPAQLAARLGERFCCHNFGVHGYGTHQVLAALQHGLVDERVRCEPRVFVYTFIEDHVRRVAGRATWDRSGPWYELASGDDGVVLRGRFDDPGGPAEVPSPLRAFLMRSHFLERKLTGRARRISQRDFALFAAVLEASADEIRRRYPGASLHVLSYQDAGWEAKQTDIRLFGELPVHRVHEILPGFDWGDEEWMMGAENKHPRPHVYAALAEYLEAQLLGQ